MNINQFKAWEATIAWAEGGYGGYGAHSGGALGNDIFYHVVLGSAFKFSTGLGPFQLDRGQSPENWPTIDKLSASLSVQSVLRWHRDHRSAGSTLADFAANSPWVAVRTPSTQWAAVTGTSWDTYKNGNVTLDWNAVRTSLSQNAAASSYRYDYSVESKGSVQWNITASVNVKTEAGKLVVFDGLYDTWSAGRLAQAGRWTRARPSRTPTSTPGAAKQGACRSDGASPCWTRTAWSERDRVRHRRDAGYAGERRSRERGAVHVPMLAQDQDENHGPAYALPANATLLL